MYLSTVSIKGLWNKPLLKLKFNKEVNFVIGHNGTGKTTVINLIAAGLAADFDRLDRIDFISMELTLKPTVLGKQTKITITKKPKSGLPYDDIHYTIKTGTTGEVYTYDLDRLAEERNYRGLPIRHIKEMMRRNGGYTDLNRQLSDIVKITHLSVNRYSQDLKSEPRSATERALTNAVNQKLDDIINQLVRFFSSLDRQYAIASTEFQRDSFVSLLTHETATSFKASVLKLEVLNEKASLNTALTEIGVEQSKISSVISKIFSSFEPARQKLSANNTMSLQEFMVMSAAVRANSLVDKYDALQEQRKKIFTIRDIFLKEVNGLFGPRKTLSINEKNEIQANSSDKKIIRSLDLSSGEKQLLIILGEALLQNSQPVVYIADEPELSLHISWQEKLVPAITRINSNAQIIFATHSPDIVGSYTNCVTSLEKVW